MFKVGDIVKIRCYLDIISDINNRSDWNYSPNTYEKYQGCVGKIINQDKSDINLYTIEFFNLKQGLFVTCWFDYELELITHPIQISIF